MVIYKRAIIEADQFKVKFGTADTTFPGISLDDNASTGIYRFSDTEVRVLLNSTDSIAFLNNQLRFFGGSTIDPGTDNTIFISGASLQWRDNTGTIRRLD